MYLKRDGSEVENLPDLEDYVKDDPEMKVETVYFVELYNGKYEMIGRIEHGNRYPYDNERRFYLLKEPEAEYITVKRMYRRTY